MTKSKNTLTQRKNAMYEVKAFDIKQQQFTILGIYDFKKYAEKALKKQYGAIFNKKLQYYKGLLPCTVFIISKRFKNQLL